MARWLLVVGLVSLAITWMRLGMGNDAPKRARPVKNWLKELRRLADPDTVDQLLAEEARRNPAGHRQVWAQAAVERLQTRKEHS